jgi:hypothetical protein
LSLRLAATRDVPQIDQAEWDISEEQGIVRARRLSQATMRNIRENLFLAFVYDTTETRQTGSG